MGKQCEAVIVGRAANFPEFYYNASNNLANVWPHSLVPTTCQLNGCCSPNTHPRPPPGQRIESDDLFSSGIKFVELSSSLRTPPPSPFTIITTNKPARRFWSRTVATRRGGRGRGAEWGLFVKYSINFPGGGLSKRLVALTLGLAIDRWTHYISPATMRRLIKTLANCSVSWARGGVCIDKNGQQRTAERAEPKFLNLLLLLVC